MQVAALAVAQVAARAVGNLRLADDLGRQRLYGLVVGQKHLAMQVLKKVGGAELVHHRPLDF